MRASLVAYLTTPSWRNEGADCQADQKMDLGQSMGDMVRAVYG